MRLFDEGYSSKKGHQGLYELLKALGEQKDIVEQNNVEKCKRSVRIGNSVKAVLFLRIKTRTKSKEKCDL